MSRFLLSYPHDRGLEEDLAQAVLVRLDRMKPLRIRRYMTAGSVPRHAMSPPGRTPRPIGVRKWRGSRRNQGAEFDGTVTRHLAVQHTGERLPTVYGSVVVSGLPGPANCPQCPFEAEGNAGTGPVTFGIPLTP